MPYVARVQASAFLPNFAFCLTPNALGGLRKLLVKTRTRKTNRINLITLGCSKNLVDSENLLTQLRGNGMDAVPRRCRGQHDGGHAPRPGRRGAGA